jgi:hypothetical protein
MPSRTPLVLGIFLVPLFTLVLSAGGAGLYSYTTAELSGPEQPIQFSHQVHAGTLGMNCLYCHSAAEDSRHAGVPSVAVCMGCHQWVKKSATTGSEEEIAKLAAYYERGEVVPWVRVHWLPEHVKFKHLSHVRFGVGCQECHGAIETMNRVYLVPDTRYNSAAAWLPAAKLEMGWCMDCHRQKVASLNCLSCHY